jgi:C-terminal peptidase prc
MLRKVLLLAALCGCATVPMARKNLDERAKEAHAPPDAAHVYVYRPGGVVGAAVRLQVLLDEVPVGVLAPSTFAVLVVRPGEHKLLVRAAKPADQVLVVEAGRDYFVKAEPTFGWEGPNASIEVVKDERAARADLGGCGLIANPAAVAIRAVAAEIARVDVDGLLAEDLAAAAARALQAMDARPAPADAGELEGTIARLRAAHPGLDDQQLVLVAAEAMLSVVYALPAAPQDESRAVARACGLTLQRRGREVVVARVRADSPAAEAGLAAGLEVREVDGHPARDQAAATVARMLAGAPGTPVALAVGRPGEPDRKVTVRRAPIEEGAVDCRVVGKRVLYLQPWELSASTGRRVRDHGRSAGEAARLVILDLRDNTGGPIDAARDLADSFLASGKMFSAAGARIRNVDKTYTATAGTSSLEEARLAVLVNGETRGVAEAIAAAVQDQHRGVVLGSRTAGKATVDFWFRVGTLQLRIPTARLVRANGAVLDRVGVTPDAADEALAAAGGGPMKDAACPNVASADAVSDDPLVQRAVRWLLASPR